VHVPDDHIENIFHLMKHLPLQEGVPRCLSQLSDAGYRLAALTNAPKAVVWERMERTGLGSYFEKILSGEEVKKFKPAGEVYWWAAKSMQVDPDKCLLITTHSWDVAGAHYAGMQTAYLDRPHQMLYPLVPAPHLVAKDLAHLVEAIA
jgi:2-haloacid dehalogenase